mgnify:FL=1
MSGPGYRKWCTKVVEEGVGGHYPSSNNALTRRHGGHVQGVSVPWVAEDMHYYSLIKQQSHPFTGSKAPPGRRALMVRFRDVVRANSLDDR